MPASRGGLRRKALGMGGGSLISNAEEVRASVEYRQYEQMGMEIRDALLQVRQQVRDEAAGSRSPQGRGHLPLLRCDYHAGCQRLLRILRRRCNQLTDKRNERMS